MLNLFPDLLVFSFFAPTLLRVALGLWLLALGYRHFFKERRMLMERLSVRFGALGRAKGAIAGLIEIAVGTLLIVGFATQIAALLAAIMMGKALFFRSSYPEILRESRSFYLLALAVALSILLTGAGAFAFDIPL